MSVREILDDLIKSMEEKNYPVQRFFNAGVDVTYIDEVIGDGSFELGSELIELYTWRNGSPFSDEKDVDVSLFCGSILSPFEYAWLSYRYFMTESFFKGKEFHFPFMHDGGGVFLFYDTHKYSSTKGMIFEYDISSHPDIYRLKFESLSSLLLGTMSCINMDVYTLNIDQNIVIDFKKQKDVFRKLNPLLPYWL